jgi:miniconductance mechanosensitive channel
MSGILEFFAQYPFLETVIGVVAVILLAYLADRISKRLLLSTVKRFVKGTASQFDDLLLELNVFGRLAHLAPALTIYFAVEVIPGLPEVTVDGVIQQSGSVEAVVQHIAAAVMVVLAVSAIGAFLTAVEKTYTNSGIGKGRPIGAYIQVGKIVLYVLAGIAVVATLLEQDLTVMLGGLGAFMAILLLVFKDTILSFVASLQMASYDLVRVGDWIEMSQFGADGDVTELSLHTVKVQNFDKTITAIPTHKLIEQPFKNWRGMQDSGGRRIKRSFYVDTNSIRFLTEDELDRLENFASLRDYIRKTRQEIADYNSEYSDDPDLIVNARRMTNVGTMRAYLVGYLKNHPKIHKDMTLIVRQLAPTSEGLPIELYVFTNITGWGDYENIQSDIFDHIFSIVPEFGLRVFQGPAGSDFARLGAVAPTD